MAEIGESLNHFLTRLEDVGVDGLSTDLEIDLRHVMNLESPSITSRLIDLEDDDLDDDLLEPFGFSPEDCSQMAKFFNRDPEDELRPSAEPFLLLPNRLMLNKEGLEDEIFEEQLLK